LSAIKRNKSRFTLKSEEFQFIFKKRGNGMQMNDGLNCI